MKASYNITNDKIIVYFDDRLSESDYARAKECKFAWWPGRKCFAAKWRPEAEDFVTSFGITIEEDDTPDDVEARVERFASHAEEAAASADSAQTYLDERANTERRRKNAVNAIEKNLSKAEHWQERIEASVRHAAFKEKAETIGGRILGLEKDQRYWELRGQPPSGEHVTEDGEKAYWVGAGRGGWWVKESAFRAKNEHAWRWLAHIEDRLAYERASYEAAGGVLAHLHPERKKAVQPKGKPTDKEGNVAEVYGAWGTRVGYRDELAWSLIVKVNRSTVDVLSSGQKYVKGDGTWGTKYYVFKREVSPSYDKFKSAEQTKKDHPEFAQGLTFYLAFLERKKDAKQKEAA
jgi:hypothetical protein